MSSSTLYRAVAEEEAAAGNLEAAKVAYARAVAEDPRDQRARAGLGRLCSATEPSAGLPPGTAQDEFQRGVDRMNHGDRQGAIAAFEAVRAGSPDRPAALLEGICLYEQGREAEARPLLEDARAEPKLAGTAALFLGLIAFHADDSLQAAALFDAAAANDSRLSASATSLSRVARRDGRLVASALAEVGYDSNVSLLPDGTVTAGGAGDGYSLTTGGLFGRPFGASGPFGRLIGQYRKQFQLADYDLGYGGVAAGYRLGRTGRYLAVEYGYDFLALGGAPYSSVQRLAADARIARGAFALGATYAARWEAFWPASTAAYSGTRQDVDVEASWHVAEVSAAAAYHLAVDGTRDPALSFVENGVMGLLRVGAGGQSRATLAGSFIARSYDAPDPDLGVQRNDRYFDLAIGGERDLSDHWTGRVTLTGRRAVSDVAAFDYTKLTASIGLAYSGGLL